MLIQVVALVLQAASAPGGGDAATPATVQIARLYDEICLQTFPIDAQVDALMMRKRAIPMTADEVKVTLRDDPGRGWWLDDGDRRYTIVLELPPFHACSVRGNVGSGAIDLGAYREVVTRFKAAHAGFAPQPPLDSDQGDIHIHAESEFRSPATGLGEQLMVIDQHITNAERRARGETGSVLRFVHQIRTRD